MINIDTDSNGNQIIDLTPFLNSEYNLKIKTNDKGTDKTQIKIKSTKNLDSCNQFENPTS